MNIAFIEIQNFRKLRACRVEIASRLLTFPSSDHETSSLRPSLAFQPAILAA